MIFKLNITEFSVSTKKLFLSITVCLILFLTIYVLGLPIWLDVFATGVFAFLMRFNPVQIILTSIFLAIGISVLNFFSNIDPNLVTVDKITAGVNAFYIYYRMKIPGTDLSSSRLYSYTRFGKENFGTEVPINLQNKQIIDISAGYAHAVAISSAGIEAKIWDYNSFAPDTEKYQYKNWNTIPTYFKRDAFFHAIPGAWDFSKWLYGDLCCGAITDANHPSQQSDTCSALAYNIYQTDESGNLKFNKNLSYSGNPHQIWMRSDWRRLSKQAFSSSFKPTQLNVSVSGKVCDSVDLGMQVGNIDDSSSAGLYSYCGADTNSVWGESRPFANQVINNTQRPIEPKCFVPSPCLSHDPTPIYTKGIIPSDAQAISRDFDIPPTISFRMTKDIFQKRVDRYGAAEWGSNGEAPCSKHWSTNISYFKYCERHYYFGYDRDLDTWDIYTNPDFLHEYTTNGLVYKPNLDGVGGETFVDSNSQNGWGGGTGPDGGTAAGLCGYYSLWDYPMTGPSYPVEKYQYLPVNYPNSLFILVGVYGAICRVLNPEGDCYTCGNAAVMNSVTTAIAYFTGAASFVWQNTCVGAATNSGENINTMWAPYRYTPYIKTYLPAKELLKGTSNHIGLTLPPEIDPTYTRYSFIDVLKNSELTEIKEPWLHPSSTKWIPLCWESESVISNICGISSSTAGIQCFAGQDEDTTTLSNELLYACVNTGVVFYTTPVTCNVAECCEPPS
jgi:hypothetical protein